MGLPERLKEARKALGFTQKEMANAVSVILQTWQVYESGKSVPGGKVLTALSDIGLNIDWLLTGKGEMKNADTMLGEKLYEISNESQQTSVDKVDIELLSMIIEAYDSIKANDEPETPHDRAVNYCMFYQIIDNERSMAIATVDKIRNFMKLFYAADTLLDKASGISKEDLFDILDLMANKGYCSLGSHLKAKDISDIDKEGD